MRYDDPRHGTPRGYTMRCRCEPCKTAKSEQNRAMRARLRSLAEKDPIALTGGAWVPRDGIMRWEEAS